MLRNLSLVSTFCFPMPHSQGLTTHGVRSCAFATGIPDTGVRKGTNPRTGLEKKKSISTEIPKPVTEVKEPSSLAHPPLQPTCHPHLQGPIHHAAWKCRSQIQSHKITVKASPARRQIPVLTAPGIKAKNRGSTWLKGCGSEKWASSLNVSSRLAGGRCMERGEPIRARLTPCQGREQPSTGSWDSIRSHTGT